ncbi:hypothetical protein EPI10_005772 [Gossypium australe]|uniref:Uncharacterized protein n=1 Tax=Gossypium australe TaxID=47621 RepID=A0A5B6WQC1_9ROSI|nr:hypothetical protein EPI10_005772 [Gossypium australe]
MPICPSEPLSEPNPAIHRSILDRPVVSYPPRLKNEPHCSPPEEQTEKGSSETDLALIDKSKEGATMFSDFQMDFRTSQDHIRRSASSEPSLQSRHTVSTLKVLRAKLQR